MLIYTVKRGLLFLPMLVGVIVVAFALIQLVPGDPVAVLLGDSATPEQIARMRFDLGLDQPLLAQFATYVGNVLQGDLGVSIFKKEPVLMLVLDRLPATLELAFGAILVSVLIGIPLGVVAALRQGSLVDLLALAFAQLGVALTVFWLAILLMYIFAVELNWLPAIGRGEPLAGAVGALIFHGRVGPLADSLSHLILPSIAMGLQGAAMICRLVRASMLEVLNSQFIRTARAKGVKERRVVWRHALANALLPVVTMIGLQFGNLLSGAVLVEGIFGWPGLGQLTVGAISQRDFPLVQGIALSFAVLVGIINLLTDLAYALIDPRIRV